MRTIWKWLDSPAAAKWLSAIAAIAFYIADYDKNGSHWLTLNDLLVFWGVWMLGRMTMDHREAPCGKSQRKEPSGE